MFTYFCLGEKILIKKGVVRWVCRPHQVEVDVHLNIYWCESALNKHLQLALVSGPEAQWDPLNVLLQADALDSVSVCHYRLSAVTTTGPGPQQRAVEVHICLSALINTTSAEWPTFTSWWMHLCYKSDGRRKAFLSLMALNVDLQGQEPSWI